MGIQQTYFVIQSPKRDYRAGLHSRAMFVSASSASEAVREFKHAKELQEPEYYTKPVARLVQVGAKFYL